jgi:hypothetical protein
VIFTPIGPRRRLCSLTSTMRTTHGLLGGAAGDHQGVEERVTARA